MNKRNTMYHLQRRKTELERQRAYGLALVEEGRALTQRILAEHGLPGLLSGEMNRLAIAQGAAARPVRSCAFCRELGFDIPQVTSAQPCKLADLCSFCGLPEATG